MYIDGLDEKDNRILEIIEKNARLSFTEIGEKVGLSRVAVKKRMEAMEKQGIICAYKTVINGESLPHGVKFFLDIETIPEFFEKVTDLLAITKTIKEIYAVSGDSRIHAVGYAPNTNTLQAFVNGLYGKRNGIIKVSCHVAISTLKNVDGGIYYEFNRGREESENNKGD